MRVVNYVDLFPVGGELLNGPGVANSGGRNVAAAL